RPVRGNATDLWVWLPIGVRRHADANAGLALGEVEWHLGELRRLDGWDSMLGKEIVDHLCVLDAHEEAEDAQHSGRHAEIAPHALSMAGPGASSRADDNLVFGKIFDDLVDKRKHGPPTAIDEALSPDLDAVRVRQNLDDRLPIEPSHLFFVGFAADHERRGQSIQGVIVHRAPPTVWPPF